MTTRRVFIRVPVGPPSIAAVAVSALLLGACTSADDDWGAPLDDIDRTTVDGADEDLSQDGMIFRDPAASGEFDPIEPEAAIDLDPEAIPEVEVPALDGPSEAVAPIVEELASVAPDDAPDDAAGDAAGGDGTADSVSEVPILDRVQAVDEGPAPDEAVRERDGNRRNEIGELVVLDEMAGLACADVESALTALDEGDGNRAAERITAAARRAGESGVEAINTWSATLAGTAPNEGGTPEMIGFLSACAQGGYEL